MSPSGDPTEEELSWAPVSLTQSAAVAPFGSDRSDAKGKVKPKSSKPKVKDPLHANIKRRSTKTFVTFQGEHPRGLNVSLDVVPSYVLGMWIVHREKTPRTCGIRCLVLAEHFSFISLAPLPHTKHSEVRRVSPFLCKMVQRREDARESSKPSLCQCRRTELNFKKKGEKKKNPHCLLSFPPRW